jgi:site-specific DNA recombinase
VPLTQTNRETKASPAGRVKILMGNNAPTVREAGQEHPRIRIPEAELVRQMLELFGGMKVQDPDVAQWFRTVLRSQTKDSQEETAAQNAELHRQRTLLTTQQSRLIDMRMGDEIDQETFARKQTELRD